VAEAATARALPWTQRLAQAIDVSPIWLGLAIAAALSAAFLVVELALDRFAALATSTDADPYRDFRLAFVNFLLLAWGPTAYLYAARGARDTRRALRPLFAGSDTEWAAVEAEAGTYPRAALRIAGLVGAVAALVSPFFTESAATTPPYDPALWNPEVVWHRWGAPAIGWFAGRFSYAVLEEGRRLSALAARLGPIELFDPTSLAPFTRQGLRHALLAAGYPTILSTFLLEWGLGAIFVTMSLWTVAVAAVSVLLAVRGAHVRIHEAKERALAACRAALREARASAADLSRDGARLARVADLLALQARLDAVREWPFDTSTLVRVTLYVLLPLGSWLGGALVERLLGRVLG
jgi:hypothetical protein